MKLSDLLQASPGVLFAQLATCIEELSQVIEQLGFLREQELSVQRLAWNGVPEDNVTRRDRAAKYACVEITGEIYRLQAARDALVERKFFILAVIGRDHVDTEV